MAETTTGDSFWSSAFDAGISIVEGVFDTSNEKTILETKADLEKQGYEGEALLKELDVRLADMGIRSEEIKATLERAKMTNNVLMVGVVGAVAVGIGLVIAKIVKR